MCDKVLKFGRIMGGGGMGRFLMSVMGQLGGVLLSFHAHGPFIKMHSDAP